MLPVEIGEQACTIDLFNIPLSRYLFLLKNDGLFVESIARDGADTRAYALGSYRANLDASH